MKIYHGVQLPLSRMPVNGHRPMLHLRGRCVPVFNLKTATACVASVSDERADQGDLSSP